MHTPQDTREGYLARAAKFVDAHVTTTDERCGQVIATSQRRHDVIVLVVRACDPTGLANRSRIFRTDNEHATISAACA